MPEPKDALPGREKPIAITEPHHVNSASLTPPWPCLLYTSDAADECVNV